MLHLYYCDIHYDQVYKTSFHQALERIQYNVCLDVKGTNLGTSDDKYPRSSEDIKIITSILTIFINFLDFLAFHCYKKR